MSSDPIDLATRLVGGVWGHLVGDAVGVPYEFRSAESIVADGPVRFGASGAHAQPPGTWSDDGALMLALLDSLLAPGGFDVEDQGRRSVAWWRDGAYTPDPGRRPFDIGNATRAALEAIESGAPADSAGSTDEYACGNGSLMRILPVALVAAAGATSPGAGRADDADGGNDADGGSDANGGDYALIERADAASRVTHGHPRAQVACSLYVLVAARLLAGERDRDGALADAADCHQRWVAGRSAEMEAAFDHLLAWPERNGKGRVWDSFWSAWDVFASAADYRETIGRAIAYGNDTDTTAAIAGGLAGIYWGIDGIPADWLAGMRGHDVADPLVDRLVALATGLPRDGADR